MLSESVDSAQLRELAAGNARQQTRVESANLAQYFSRLAAIVANRDDSEHAESGRVMGPSDGLAIDVSFSDSPERFPCVHIGIDGYLSLDCQRCLQPVRIPVNLEARLTILGTEAEMPRISEPFDSIVMTSDGLNLPVVIEDEILSTLPIAPIHESEIECAQFGNALYKSKIEAAKPNRPFSALAPLLGAMSKERDD